MLDIKEILDRFEILHPNNENFTNLRRAYTDKDLSSIFKLLSSNVSKLNIEDLRKLILDDNIWKLWPILSIYSDTEFIPALKNLLVENIEYEKDCFSRGQLTSKLWLIDELKKLNLDLGTVFLCAGWYGILSVMLFENNLKVSKVRSFDIDPSTLAISEIFNKKWVKENWKFKPCLRDILDIDYNDYTYNVKKSDGSVCELRDSPDTIINTSCEHISNFKKWYDSIPNNKLLILQSNNYFKISEHVNCSENLYDFDRQTPMTTVLYLGEKELSKYTRFMKIGIK